MQMKFVDVGGVMTRCIEAGEKGAPPLILVHGISITSDLWLRNIDALGQDFHVVAADMLGHGFTCPRDPGTPVTVQDKIDHLLGVADAYGFDRFAISGSSYGGLISANVYLQAPERFTKLIINGSGSSFNTEAQLAGFVEKIYTSYKPVLTSLSPEGWGKLLEGTFHDPASIPRELTVLLSLCYAQPWAAGCWEQTIATMRDMERFRPYRILERLQDIAVPTLVVWGLQDRGGVFDQAIAAVSEMPDASLEAIDNCGHLPMAEHPDQYNNIARAFLLK
ncbi:MAG: alpha/beta fold hydrolase [Rhodospirillales bacterium]|nr:alpha/beta fold hydrolase [Rhodospirillales bacterium]